MVASVSVLGALVSLSASRSALDIVFLWQLAQLLLNRGCAAIRSAGPAMGGRGCASKTPALRRRHRSLMDSMYPYSKKTDTKPDRLSYSGQPLAKPDSQTGTRAITCATLKG